MAVRLGGTDASTRPRRLALLIGVALAVLGAVALIPRDADAATCTPVLSFTATTATLEAGDCAVPLELVVRSASTDAVLYLDDIMLPQDPGVVTTLGAGESATVELPCGWSQVDGYVAGVTDHSEPFTLETGYALLPGYLVGDGVVRDCAPPSEPSAPPAPPADPTPVETSSAITYAG